MRRIIKLVVAAIAAALVLLGAPAPASAEAPSQDVVITVVRSTTNCDVITVKATGLEGTTTLYLAMGWRYTSAQYHGKGGVNPAQWRKTVNVSQLRAGKHLPKKAFEIVVVFYDKNFFALAGANLILPACKTK